LHRIAGEGGKVDGNWSVGGRIVAELAESVWSPRPEVAIDVDGEGVAVAGGNLLEHNFVAHKVGTGNSGGLTTGSRTGVWGDASDGGGAV